MPAYRRNFPPVAESDIDELVFRAQVPVIVYVTGARSCIAIAAKREFLHAALDMQSRVAIYEVDGPEEKAIVSRLNIKVMPSLLVYISGIEVAVMIGFYGRDDLLRSLWSTIPDS